MDAATTLRTLSEAGFTVVLDSARIVVTPATRLDDNLRAAIRAHRDELATLLASVEREASELIERLRRADPGRWTSADVDEARRTACRDYPAGINCLRALTGSKK